MVRVIKHTLVFHLLGVSKKLQKAIGYKSNPPGLSFSQARALLVIDSQAEISQSEIAQRLQLEPGSVVTLIDELEKLKIARRKTPSNNRRKYHIDLTDKGKTHAHLIRKQSQELENYIHKNLSTQEAEKLLSAVNKLNIILDAWQHHKYKNGEEVKDELSSAKRYLAP